MTTHPAPPGTIRGADGRLTPANAGRPLAGFDAFRDALMRASYHFADDSGREWGRGHDGVSEAGRIAVAHGWRAWQIVQAHAAAESLTTLDQVLDACAHWWRQTPPDTACPSSSPRLALALAVADDLDRRLRQTEQRERDLRQALALALRRLEEARQGAAESGA